MRPSGVSHKWLDTSRAGHPAPPLIPLEAWGLQR